MKRVLAKRLGDVADNQQSSYVQDGFTIALERFDSFRGKSVGEFYNWLMQIVFRRAQERLRRDERGRQILAEIGKRTSQRSQPRDPASWIVQREQAAMVVALLDELPAADAEVLKRRYLDDWSIAEIAAGMECSENAVRLRLSRAVPKLRRKWEQRA